MNIKHSKYKNTGILFELLVRQITADTLSGNDSKATGILKKYFVRTELGKEYKLYETLSKHKNLTEGKAEVVVNSVIESSKNLNRGAWRLLEAKERELAKTQTVTVEIRCHFTKTSKVLPSGATIPDGFWKTITYGNVVEKYYFKNEKPATTDYTKFKIK